MDIYILDLMGSNRTFMELKFVDGVEVFTRVEF